MLQDNIPSTIDQHAFADDHGLKTIIIEHNAISDLVSCVHDVEIWMNENDLKMNASKTDLIIFCSQNPFQKSILLASTSAKIQ